MRKKSIFAVLATLSLFCLTLAQPAWSAKAKKAAPQAPKIEEKATEVLDKLCKTLSGLKTYSFKAELSIDKVYEDGSKIQASRSMEVSVARPDKFRVVTQGDDVNAISSYDGKTFSISLPEKKIYALLEASLETDALIDMLAAKYGLESPLGDLMANNPCAKFTAAAKAGYYVGKSKLGKALCDHLFFQGADADWQLWIEDSAEPKLLKIVITEKNLPQAPQFTALFSDWQSQGPAISSFSAPEGFTRDDAVITGGKKAAKEAK